MAEDKLSDAEWNVHWLLTHLARLNDPSGTERAHDHDARAYLADLISLIDERIATVIQKRTDLGF